MIKGRFTITKTKEVPEIKIPTSPKSPKSPKPVSLKSSPIMLKSAPIAKSRFKVKILSPSPKSRFTIRPVSEIVYYKLNKN